jgi:hypothetical protein
MKENTTKHVKRTFYSLFAVVLLMLAASVGHAETYQILSTQNSVVAGNLNKSVTTVQVGANPINRFLITRVVKNVPNQALKGTILLLSPLGNG